MLKCCWFFYRLGYLEKLLPDKVTYLLNFFKKSTHYVGWGDKNSGILAQRLSKKYNKPCILLEDGFLLSAQTDCKYSKLSLIYDDIGIYYNAIKKSRLEIEIAKPRSETQIARVQNLQKQWQNAKVSKYNNMRDYSVILPNNYVLVIDQSLNDLSISGGLANQNSFDKMLKAALNENPDSQILVKIHPDTLTGKSKGYFKIDDLYKNIKIQVIVEPCSIAMFLAHAKKVYVVTSQVGFEALIWQKPVRCFGMPFYAGWGLTNDELPPPNRRKKVSLWQLIYASLIEYPRYWNPEKQECCEIENIIEHIGLQIKMRNRYDKQIFAYNFSFWKTRFIRQFFNGSTVIFCRSLGKIPRNSTIILWGKKLIHNINYKNFNIIQIEDGFLRSVGLGANLIPPLSLAIDDMGIYYDSSKASRLEYILENHNFNEKILIKAKHLNQEIIKNDICKYNLPNVSWKKPQTNKRILLVPGQVELDASIAFASPKIQKNLELLQTVRKNNLDAYIIYKPHPDLVAKLRQDNDNSKKLQQYCDEIITKGNIANIINQIDELHTMTSLSGFEALLRNKKVVCYGQPFYAGWGLTKDIHPITRRTRCLNIYELIAGTLIKYPTYISKRTGFFSSAENIISELVTQAKH